jgi:hypothetical protein
MIQQRLGITKMTDLNKSIKAYILKLSLQVSQLIRVPQSEVNPDDSGIHEL